MKQAPSSICILRLSAIGDVTHMIPVVRTLQKHWPNTKLTWVIGKKEVNLVNDLPNINFVVFDKTNAIKSYRSIKKTMKDQIFDVLICAQVSLRANYISSLIPAKLKLGYDKARAKDLHSLFVNKCIPATNQQHVLDSFFSFIEQLGLNDRELKWNYPITKEAYEFADQFIDKDRFNLLISPCSSHAKRNWSSARYASVADYSIQTFNANVILCGGPSDFEKQTGADIEQAMQNKATNLIGKDTLNKFLALLKQARCSYHTRLWPRTYRHWFEHTCNWIICCQQQQTQRPLS